MIKGETIVLIEKAVTGYDGFNHPVVESVETEVENVLVGSPTFEASNNELDITGKRLEYVLGIPKGDTHNWNDAEVIIRGQRFSTYGFPMTQTEENVPGPWNTQVKVEAYE